MTFDGKQEKMNCVRTVPTVLKRSSRSSELHKALTPPFTLAEFVVNNKH